MMAHRISYFLRLKGPSMTLDSACSSSGYALENAYAAIRSGEIDNAIVGGTHLCLNPMVAMEFVRLSMLKLTDTIILQKAKHSKGIYSKIVHAKTNSDGFKEKGITFPSKEAQMELLRDPYEDCGVDRLGRSYVEAPGTGSNKMTTSEGFSSDTKETIRDKYYHEGGKLLANPPPGEEIVISGMAGVFPNSNDICELGENLFNKIDLVQSKDRWHCGHPDLPIRCGAIPEIDRYDGGFFGVHERQSYSLDPMGRIFQEKVLEAVFDAGLHPSELEGTRTGVYVGVISNENGKAWFMDNLRPQTFAMTGSQRSMIAHRISYFLKLRGPSTTVDSQCGSSGYALENAYAAIRSGEIDNAIVGGTHLALNPYVTMDFFKLGAVNKTACCKTFDIEADGYARAEGIVAVVLQKAKHSKRTYARIVHAKTNCDGFKEQGILFPSTEGQGELLRDLYEDCGVDRFSLSFLEAHGTGTKVGDVVECASFDAFFTGGRRTPLPIGSVKSNMGHTEAASCLSSVVKCLLVMETGFIPPNIHFNTPNEAIAGLMEGRLKVVVDKTPLEDENALIGINSFGLGGTNSHVLLKRTSKRKVGSEDDLPRLVCVSGRTEEAVDVLLEQVEANAGDVEYIKLLHEVFKKGIQNHLYRGFTVVSRSGTVLKSSAICREQDKPLYVVFGELENWREIGGQLVALPVFRDFILKIQEHLAGKGVSISDAPPNDGLLDGNRFPVLGAMAVRMAVVHLLELVDVKVESCFGDSVGELASAYHGKLLTLEDTVHCAFIVNEACLNDEILRKIKDSLRNKVIHFQENSVVLKIGEAVLDDTEEVYVIPLFRNGEEGYLVGLLAALGRLYLNGHDPQIARLYPEVDFPVGRGTPMISPYVRWNHYREKFVPRYHLDFTRHSKRGIRDYTIDVAKQQWAFIAGHVVDGKNLFPASGYLYMVWETFSIMQGVPLNASRVSLRNCRFLRATSVPSKGSVVFTVSILNGKGDFEVVEGNSIVATGTIGLLPDDDVKVRSLGSTPDLEESRDLWMDKKDVYKEMRLRGYQYSGEFQSVQKYDSATSTAYLKWTKNWIAFLDGVLQLTILRTDVRALRVPTFMFRVDIGAEDHLAMIGEAFKDSPTTTPNLPTHSDRSTEDITCGGVTLSGIIIAPIVRKKNSEKPLLQTHRFIPNFAELALDTSVMVNSQIILENTMARKIKAVEVVDEHSDDDVEPMAPIIKSHLHQSEFLGTTAFRILSARALDVDVDVEKGKLEDGSDCLLVVVSKAIERPEILKSALAALKENGFVISRESPHCEVRSDSYPDMFTITMHRTPSETIVLLRQNSQRPETRYVEVNPSGDFSWLPEVQDALNGNPQEDLVLHSRDPTSGILGMVRSLRKEYAGGNIRCVFLMDEGEEFDPDSRICGEQLRKNLAFNVYRNGQWGTFRHLPLVESNAAESEHCFVDIASRGDLSSLRWTEGALTHRTTPESEKELIYVYYSAINFKDVMIATGKMNVELDHLDGEAFLGIEFSGRDKRGKRVMGCCDKGSLTNLFLAEKDLVYGMPEEWTMEEAATVPIAYTTAIYALVVRGQMKRGDSALVHSGAGGVGQAAINLALHYGCQVFTTVGTRDKREFLKRTYPQLKDENIANSHDESFEQMVLEGTKGKGVDVVLNSLTGERLVASARCLAVGGRFLDMGKFDSRNNLYLLLELLKKQASFHGVMVDNTLAGSTRCEIRETFERLMREGAVRPLNRSVFEREEVEQAFRVMASGRHTGKVLIRAREPEEQLVLLPPSQTLRGVARYYCDPQMVYVIVGGLGGFGLELADWLVLRGARKLVLTSRKGISTGYQQHRIRLWQSYGVVVHISTAPLATRRGCERLMEETSGLGGIAAVFNLAVVLDDAVFDNQTPGSFRNAFEPKVDVTKHLDDVTRKTCPGLRDFVVFSSYVSTRGNVGQTNYSMASSATERICERRRKEGYPALAIQWGLVGDVGIVAETLTEVEIKGLASQPISSCLEVLDALLAQRQAVVVSSVVVAQKEESQAPEGVVDAILNIMGMKDSKSVSMHSTLAELGMDSMLAIEVKVTLERNFDVFLSLKEMRTTTLARLKEIQEGKTGTRGDPGTRHEASSEGEPISKFPTEDFGDELKEKSTLPKAVLFPGIEGVTGVLEGLSGRLIDVRIIQYVPDEQSTSVAKIVESLFPTVLKLLPEDKTFFFVAYSYGTLIALEMVNVLESQGYEGTLICIDGAPLVVKRMANSLNAESDQMMTNSICQLLSLFVPREEIVSNEVGVSKYGAREEKVHFATDLVKNYDADKARYVEKTAGAIYRRYRDLDTYRPTYGELKSDVKLFRATVSSTQDVEGDYGLSRFFRKTVEIRYFEGNHQTILENQKLADAINLAIQKLC